MVAGEFWIALRKHKSACCFNAKFEILWMKRCGFDVDDIKWHDPMLAEKVLLGNIQLPMNMGDMAGRYGFDTKDALIDSLMKSGVCPSDMPQKRLRARCNRDVRVTRSLMAKQLRKLKRNDQIHLYRNRCDFAVVLAHIEANGMHLDSKRVNDEFSDYSRQLANVSKELALLTGGINMNSPDQKAHFLYGELKFPEKRGQNRKPLRNKPSKQFPDGRPKTDAATLLWLAGQARTEKQKTFIRLTQLYSKVNAALSKNLQFFKGVCDEKDGTFHAQFNQTVAATHRLTSSGMPLQFKDYDKTKSVQFQNMPRVFKGCFDAPDGYWVVEVDAMQLEFRVAAYEGQDVQALLDIGDPDFDAHCRTASVLHDIPYGSFLRGYRGKSGPEKAKAYKDLRQQGKPDTFKPLYGGTMGTPAQMKYYKSFTERYSGIAAAQENWLAEVMQTGELRTPWGMVFKWDVYVNSRGVAMNKKTHKPVGPQVFNYPVQNLATAEIVPIAIVALYKRCKEEGIQVKFVNTVHDSVIAYVSKSTGHLKAFRKAAEWAFTTAVYEHLAMFYGVTFNVPLGMEMVAGDFWGEGKETKYDDVENRSET
jgi:DNA polymerase I-like protein with 3'-5' exonuclease and polymerase domains